MAVKFRDRHARAISAAAAYRRDGDAARAIEILGEVLGAAPDHAAANVEMGRALRLLGDPAEAEGFYRAAIAEVLDYVAICELAQVVAEQDRVDEARELLDGALAMANGTPRLDPGEALLVIAAIALSEGAHDEARSALDKIHRKRARPATLRVAAEMRARIDASSSEVDRP